MKGILVMIFKKKIENIFCDYYKKNVKNNWPYIQRRLQSKKEISIPKKHYPKIPKYIAAPFIAILIFPIILSGSCLLSDQQIIPSGGGHDAPMSCDPVILNYNHRLYITNTKYLDGKTQALPDRRHLLGYSENYPVFPVLSGDINKIICCSSTPNSKKFSRYDYICDDSFTVNNIRYNLISVINYKYHNLSEMYNVNSKPSYIRNFDKPIIKNNDYIVNWCEIRNRDDMNYIKNSIDSKLCELKFGSIYKVKNKKPSEAIFLKTHNKWLRILKPTNDVI